MDDGINAIILIISVLLISLFFFVYFYEGLSIVFFIILTVLTPLLIYTYAIVITTNLDNYKAMKEWEKYEEMEKIQPPFIK